MTGTIVNVLTVLVGSAIGMLLKSKLPERLTKTVFQSLGLFILALGFIMAIKAEDYLIIVSSLLIGLGINILEIKKIKIFNILPALVLVVFFTWAKSYINL